MIRFIDIGKQVGLDEEWGREFCFWNTVTDRFIEFAGHQMWRSWEDFREDYEYEKTLPYPIERFKNVCPDWIFNVENA